MGILDDAIREHLELKRKHGADEDELKELEDSAFGPPGRPGEDEIEALADALPAEAATDGGDATTVMAADAGYKLSAEAEGLVGPEEEDLTPAEQARQEYPQLQDTAPHEPVSGPEPALEVEPPLEVEPVLEADPIPEVEPIPGPEPVQSTEEQDALEIDLFESEDAEEDFDVGEIGLDLDEAEIDDLAPELLPEDPAPEHELVESAEIVDPDPTDEGVIGGEAHDMLEETPDFLKDAPESDEMWFEQDEPEDFDFD